VLISSLSEIFGVDPFRPPSETTPSVDELSIFGGEELLVEFASAARKNKVKALISIGGVSECVSAAAF
jgi:hypothetical protein